MILAPFFHHQISPGLHVEVEFGEEKREKGKKERTREESNVSGWTTSTIGCQVGCTAGSSVASVHRRGLQSVAIWINFTLVKAHSQLCVSETVEVLA